MEMGDKDTRKRLLDNASPKKKKPKNDIPLSMADLDAAISRGVRLALQDQQPAFEQSINFAVKQAMDTIVVPQLRQIQADIEKNNEGMKGMRCVIDKQAIEVKQTKDRVDNIQVVVRTHSEQLHELRTQVEQLSAQSVEMQDRARRNNIRLVHLEDNIEGKDAAGYLTTNLPKWIPALAGRNIEIERAHRIYVDPKKKDTLSNKPPPPRTMIFRLLRWQDKVDILREARKAYPVKLGQSTLLFFQDFSPQTVARRKKFNTAISEARNQGLQSFLGYPATLQIEHGGKKRSFECHEKAEKFLRSLKRPASYADAAKSPPAEALLRASGPASSSRASPPAMDLTSTADEEGDDLFRGSLEDPVAHDASRHRLASGSTVIVQHPTLLDKEGADIFGESPTADEPLTVGLHNIPHPPHPSGPHPSPQENNM